MKNPYLVFGAVISALMLVFCLVGCFWTPYDPAALSTENRYALPSLAHPFGCDALGRDIFSRVLLGAGTTLSIAFAVLVIGFALGLTAGALCGYYGGAVDAVLMRFCDAVAAFPSVLLALVVLALTGPGKSNVIFALGLLFVPSFARLTRGEFLRQRDLDYVQSAKLMGVSDFRIIFVHILPNTWQVLLSGLTIGFNNAVLAEASMSYLGIGVTPQDPSLGYMLSEAQSYLGRAPWYAGFLALTAVMMILGAGLLGEGIRSRNGGEM